MASNVGILSRRTPLPASGHLDRSRIRAVAALLAGGGVAVLPTDTIYGLHCAASRREALERIRKLKGRGAKSGFILLAADMAMVERVVARWPGESRRLLGNVWPAPLTAILPAGAALPRIISPGRKVAVRIPARDDLRALIAAVGEPIVSTSVNLVGKAPMRRIAGIRRTFPGLEAYLSGTGRAPASPSTIVDFTSVRPRLVRAGLYRWTAA
jgi:tRNA threonylcarbamoyl adenosine modification protein (Sua5/YciO/YrdC/YwlC family)